MNASAGHNGTRTLCVITDPALRRRLRRSLRATGTMVEFCKSVEEAKATVDAPNLLFLDKESRRDADLPFLLQVMDKEGKVVILGESIADDEFVALMRQQPFNNIIDDAEPDENELVVTSVKLLTGDIFGLDKYLSWGADIHSVDVADYDQKRDAIAAVAEMAKQVGARRKIIGRIENVADEILMNAIYDAPAAAGGMALDTTISTVMSAAAFMENPAATLSYGCDGRYFGVSVVDHFGKLQRDSILDNLLRARASGGSPREGTTGAGLGIYLVLSSCTRYIANIQQDIKTEIICLFDMRLSGRETSNCATSLHIFTT